MKVEMTFLEHLSELRRRLFISALATVIGTSASFIFKDRLFDFEKGLLTLPLRLRATDIINSIFNVISQLGFNDSIFNLFYLFLRSRSSSSSYVKLFAASPTEKFMVAFKGSLAVGTLLAAPVIIYQMWAFVIPALRRIEKQYILPLFFIALFFFSIGAVFAFLVVSPIALSVLSGILPSIENQWRIDYYFSFLIRLMLGFGLAFELPMVMGFVAWIGVFSASSFRKQRKIAVVVIFIAAAALTPQDPFTMLLMAIPLLVLYEIGIWFATMIGERKTKIYEG